MESSRGIVLRILQNLGFTGLAVLVSKISQLALLVMLARWLGAEGLGQYTYALSVVLLAGILSDLGITQYVVSQVSRDKEQTGWYLSHTFGLRLGLSLLGLAITVILAMALPLSSTTQTLLILLGLGQFFVNVTLGWRWIFQARQKMKYEALLLLIFGLVYSLFGLVLLMWQRNVIWAGAGYLLGGVVFFCVCALIVKKSFPDFKLGMEISAWRQILTGAFPMTLYVLFICTYYNADTILLSHLQGESATGIYNASNRLIQQLRQIPALLAPAFLPAMAQLAAFQPERFAALLKKGLFYLFSLFLPLVILVFFLSGQLIHLLYGGGFSASGSVLQIQIWAALFEIFNGFVFISLMAQKRYKALAILTGGGAAINLLLNFLFIPALSVQGAALAIVGSELAVFAGSILILQREYHLRLAHFGKILGLPMAAGAVMVIIWILFSGWNWVILTATSLAAYFSCLILSRSIPAEDRRLWKGLLLNWNKAGLAEAKSES